MGNDDGRADYDHTEDVIRTLPIDEFLNRAQSGDRRALARLFTRIERNSSDLRDVMRLAYPHSGDAAIVGVTGPPGAGKSTLVDGLVQQARVHGETVGVLAVDPTSALTGGAVLGDRIRMQAHHADPDVFIRSVATRGASGGLAAVARAGVRLLEAVSKSLILVETVGVGQTELDVVGIADMVVVVLVPESGDTVQTMKAGILEIGDIFVVNKADRNGAGQLVTAINAMLSLGHGPNDAPPPVLTTEAHRGVGVPELYQKIAAGVEECRESGRLTEHRKQGARLEVRRLLTSEVMDAVERVLDEDDFVSDILNSVESGELDPYSAAHQILDDGLVSDALLKSRQRDDSGGR